MSKQYEESINSQGQCLPKNLVLTLWETPHNELLITSHRHFTCKLYVYSFTRFLMLVLELGVSVTMTPDLSTPHTPFLPIPTSFRPLSCPLSKVLLILITTNHLYFISSKDNESIVLSGRE